MAREETFVETRGLIAQPRFMNRRFPACFALASLVVSGCVSVKTEPIEVKPIHITVDVNVKVDRALDDFFGDLDKKSTTIATPATAAAPAKP